MENDASTSTYDDHRVRRKLTISHVPTVVRKVTLKKNALRKREMKRRRSKRLPLLPKRKLLK